MGPRIKALPTRYPGIEELGKGNVLAEDLDPELQALSERASREIGVPMAAVSLVLEDKTYLRAYHGLPAEARVTDRDASYCQLVVSRGEMLEVNDASSDLRVPSESADKYGVVAYLGAPIVINGKTIGSMCAIDVVPRLFDDRERAMLRRIAADASTRLTALATQPRDLERTLHDRAVRPAFSEVRNRLQPLLGNIPAMQTLAEQIRAAAYDLRGDVHAARDKLDHLLDEMQDVLHDTALEVGHVHRSIVAIERASLICEAPVSIHDIIEPATTLAHHRTKLVEGVTWCGQCRSALRVPRAVAVNALAAALAGIAGKMNPRATNGITAEITSSDDMALVELSADIDDGAVIDLAVQLASLIGDSSQVRVRDRSAKGTSLLLGFETIPLS